MLPRRKGTQIIVKYAKIIPTMSVYLPKNAYFCGVFRLTK